MVNHLSISFALLLCAGVALADDERERRVRVALALAAAERAPLPGYAEAYRLAVEKDEPLVVFVGCDGRHPIERLPKVVVCAATELSGYERGSVVIGYPRDGKLFVHATLRCPDHGEPVAKAAEDARKKIAAPPAKPLAAPVPLNWNVLEGPCVNGACQKWAVGSRR